MNRLLKWLSVLGIIWPVFWCLLWIVFGEPHRYHTYEWQETPDEIYARQDKINTNAKLVVLSVTIGCIGYLITRQKELNELAENSGENLVVDRGSPKNALERKKLYALIYAPDGEVCCGICGRHWIKRTELGKSILTTMPKMQPIAKA